MRERRDIRLFFALWPDISVREEIAERLKPLRPKNGRIVPQYNWHMTLHFVGNTSFEEKNCLHRQAGRVHARPFDLLIDQSGYFKKPRVFWLGCRNIPDALFSLHRELANKISHCEYQPETRPYSPHITVLRKLHNTPETSPFHQIFWRVDRFVLIESVSEPGGVRYQVLEEYPLDKPAH